MSLSRLDFIGRLHKILQDRQYHSALQYCEENLEGSKDEFVIVEYVCLLINLQYYEKAYEKLVEYTNSPYQSMNVYHMYEDYYTGTGRQEELKILQEGLNARECCNLEGHRFYGDPEYHGSDRLLNQFAEELKYWSAIDQSLSGSLKKTHNLLTQGLFDECNQTLNYLIKKKSNSLISNYLEAELSLISGQLERAECLFLQVLNEYPNPAVIHDRLGDIASRRGRYKDAVRHYQHSLNYDGNSEQTWLELIECFGKLGKSDMALKYIKRLKARGELKPDSIKAVEIAMDSLSSFLPAKRVYGLVVTEGGGNLLPIDFASAQESGCLVTGNISMNMYDSVQIAYRYVKPLIESRTEASGIHVNVPQSICYKDGPSAGLAFAMGMLSALNNKPIPSKNAFTGEVDLMGTVHPVGGVYNKILAAWYNNMDCVWLPAKNLRDTRQLPVEIKNRLSLRFINSVREVANKIWMN